MNNTQRLSRSRADITHIRENTQDHIPKWLRSAYADIWFYSHHSSPNEYISPQFMKYNNTAQFQIPIKVDDNVVQLLRLWLWIKKQDDDYEVVNVVAGIRFVSTSAGYEAMYNDVALMDHVQRVVSTAISCPVHDLQHEKAGFALSKAWNFHWQLHSPSLTACVTQQLNPIISSLYGMALID